MALYLILYNQGLKPDNRLPKSLYCDRYHKGDVIKAVETNSDFSDAVFADDRYLIIRISNEQIGWGSRWTEEPVGDNAPRRRFNVDVDTLNGGQRLKHRARRPFVHDLSISSQTFEGAVSTKPDWSAP